MMQIDWPSVTFGVVLALCALGLFGLSSTPADYIYIHRDQWETFEQFNKAYPNKCMRFNDQWVTKDGKQLTKLEEFPCLVSEDYRPAAKRIIP